MNIGVRHILVVYVFLYVLIGGAAWALIAEESKVGLRCGSVLLVHAASSVMAFPNYIPYGNELWGGPSQTHKYLTDSNSDWGQQLKSVKQYLDQRGVKECWFLYFAEGVAEPSYYGIPCKPLPTISTLWLNVPIDVPNSIDGPVLISASNLSGVEFGPGSLDPYGQFKLLKPTAVIDRGVFVFDGKFDMPLAAAISKVQKAQNLVQAKQLDRRCRKLRRQSRWRPIQYKRNLRWEMFCSRWANRNRRARVMKKHLSSRRPSSPSFRFGLFRVLSRGCSQYAEL